MHAPHHRFTFEDYLRVEEDSAIRHEFAGGQIFAMSGGSPEHARICANVITMLGAALTGRPCAVFSPDLRIRVQATGIATYPDASVICGAIELDPADPKRHTALNPRVLVEVLSPSTEEYDRGEKLANYKLIPALEEVVLVAHDRREITLVRREPDRSWSSQTARDGEAVEIASLACRLEVAAVYRDPLAR